MLKKRKILFIFTIMLISIMSVSFIAFGSKDDFENIKINKSKEIKKIKNEKDKMKEIEENTKEKIKNNNLSEEDFIKNEEEMKKIGNEILELMKKNEIPLDLLEDGDEYDYLYKNIEERISLIQEEFELGFLVEEESKIRESQIKEYKELLLEIKDKKKNYSALKNRADKIRDYINNYIPKTKIKKEDL